MIINKLSLENFGIYSGKHNFDLKPKRNKNVILIGGQNGNGKTTFFDAIKLCLYGIKIMNGSFQKRNYDKYLVEKIHNNPLKKIFNDSASVELEFQYSTLGELDTYKITRSWTKKDNNLIEELFNVEKNNSPLEIDPEQWQEFINGLIPPGLSKLFFFDGEKLQDLAGDMENGSQLRESFDSLMGIDLVDKLRADLKIYSNKNLKIFSGDEKKKLYNLEKVKEANEQAMESLSSQKAETRSKIDFLNSSIEKVNDELNLEGGSFAIKKNDLEIKKKNYELKINQFEEEMKEMCTGRLPFAFSLSINNHLKKSLLQEQKCRKQIIFNESINEKFKSMRKTLLKENEIKQLFSKKEDLAKFFKKIEENLKNEEKATKKGEIHNLSENELQKIFFLFSVVESEDKKRFVILSKKYEKLSKEVHKLEKEIAFAPEESVVKPYLDKLLDLNRKLGFYESRLNFLDEDKNKNILNMEKINREIKKIENQANFKDGLINKARLVEKVEKVLRKYGEEFKRIKIEEFSKEFIKSFNFLIRKKDLCSRIEINPKNYEVTLYNPKEQKIPKRILSAGEKQIYALAVLWTLTRISKRSLPFIIDTPMGRLDKEHRDSFVLNFLPKAGQQLIILSTNSEIDVEYSKKLKPFLAKKIILEYADGETKPVKGYFKE